MPACAPVSDTALPPWALIAMAVSAMVCLLAGGQQHIQFALRRVCGETSFASFSRLSVTPDMAETTATT